MSDEPQRTARSRSSRVYSLCWATVPAVVVLVVGALRVDDVSMWMDEAFTAESVRLPFGDFLRFLRIEAGMGPYYISLWFWTRITGFSPEAIRLWSVIGAAVAAGAFGALLSRRRAGRTSWSVVVIGALLLTCNPLFLRMITEARAYSWMMAGAAVALLLLESHVVRPRLSLLAAIALSVGIFGAMHPLALYFHGLVLVVAVVAAWNELRLWTSLAIATLLPLVGAPFLWVTYRVGGGQIGWIGAFTWGGVRQTLGEFAGRPIVVLPLVVLAVAASIDRRSDRSDPRRAIVRYRHELLLVVPIIVLIVQSFRVNGVLTRYFSPLIPILALQCTRGAEWIIDGCRRRLRPLAIAALVVLVALVLPRNDAVARPELTSGFQDYRTISRALVPLDWDDTAMIVTEFVHTPGLWLYASDDMRRAWHPQPDSDLKPWGRLFPNGPTLAPTTCQAVVVSESPDTTVTEILERRYSDNWLTRVSRVSTFSILNFDVHTFRNPDCG